MSWYQCVIGELRTAPDDVAAVQNDRFGKVWDGTSLNQWSKTAYPLAMALSTGTWSGVSPRMICRYCS